MDKKLSDIKAQLEFIYQYGVRWEGNPLVTEKSVFNLKDKAYQIYADIKKGDLPIPVAELEVKSLIRSVNEYRVRMHGMI